MNRVLLIILSILLMSIGLSFIILDLNLLVINYTFKEYLIYVITHLSSNIFFIGLFLLYKLSRNWQA